METAGFADIVVTDVTGDFLETARRWLRYTSELESELRSAVGDAVFDEQQADRAETIPPIEEGLLSRALFEGTSP